MKYQKIKKNLVQSKKNNPEKIPGEKHQKLFLYGSIVLILVATFICFYSSFHARFSNWDDPYYVLNNPLVKNLSGNNLSKMVSEPSVSNYHPLTILSLALDYSRAQSDIKTKKIDPFPFHQTNIFLHLLNVLLVFIFIYLLSNKKWLVAAIVAFLFGMHPMHVESVSWISGRKDLLYTLFFLSSLILYMYYLRRKNSGLYLLSFLVFILSLLSKPAAAPMGLILLLIDYYLNRFNFRFTVPKTWKNIFAKQELKIIAEKIPFLIAGVIIIYITYKVQEKVSVTDFRFFSIPQKFLFSFYGFSMYMFRLLFPLRLSAFYPYPEITAGNALPGIFYLTFVTTLLFMVIPIVYERKSKLGVFGLLFFFIMVMLVLQFITLGKAIMADRYTYLSFIGPFFIIAQGFNQIRESKVKQVLKWKYPIMIAGCIYLISMPVLCYERTRIWTNSETLWSDVMTQYPRLGFVYKNRGLYYQLEVKSTDLALRDFQAADRLQLRDPDLYNCLGCMQAIKGDLANSIISFTNALKLDSAKSVAYKNRAISWFRLKKYTEALSDCNHAILTDAENNEAYSTRGYIYLETGEFQKAIQDYNYLIKLFPDSVDYYVKRAVAKYNITEYNEAAIDFMAGLKLRQNDPNILYNAGVCFYNLKNYEKAFMLIDNARKTGYLVEDNFYDKVRKLGKKQIK
ncbi:MAG: tetratricopeptide repeat protein [Bacteroidetes bacterium]|nr:tetratricopeptide repeat protein [Bacteroidota bacterium]